MKEVKKISMQSIFAVLVIIGMMALVSSGFSDLFKNRGITGRATTSSVTVNITISAPFISFVSPIPAQTPTEDATVTIFLNFTANNGTGALNDSTARVNFSRSGETTRFNNSCNLQGRNNGTSSNYTCTLYMWYFDQNGAWTVNAIINESTSTVTSNATSTFTYNTLTAFKSAPGSLTFPTLSPASTNITSNNDPTLLNNTGNVPITAGNVQLNATNLVGETDTSKIIFTENFSIGINTGSNAECDVTADVNNATILSRAVFTALNQSNISRGNYTVNNAVTGQEQLYLCIRRVNADLTSQPYSTSSQGAWTLRVQ